MDFIPLIIQALSTLWYLIPLVMFLTVIKTPWFKGVVGEFIVNIGAKLFLNKEEYHLIKNVTLPTEDGSTQIDHIIVSKYGVFVVETKHMKGWIFGSLNQKEWTQKIYKHSSKFQNPLHQNYKHTKVLQALLGLSEAQLFSVVVFTGDSTFKTGMPENVTHGKGYIRYIKSKNTSVLTNTQVKEITEKIQAGRLTPSFKMNREHVKYVQSIVAEKEKTKICPKCSSFMVLREVKKGLKLGGKFWGCSKFPKCRGVVNIT